MKRFSRLLGHWKNTVPPPHGEAVADPDKIVWVSPFAIRFKLMRASVLHLRNGGKVQGGDWDLDRRPIEETVKFKSVMQRFRDGLEWENTDLFKGYARRFARGDKIRGCRSIGELKDVYRNTMDKLYADLRDNGFVIERTGWRKKNTPAYIYIGRDGEIIFGTSGNHRFAMARLLKLERIACWVLCRHAEWQALREKLASHDAASRSAHVDAALAGHPDLQDLLSPHDRPAAPAAGGA